MYLGLRTRIYSDINLCGQEIFSSSNTTSSFPFSQSDLRPSCEFSKYFKFTFDLLLNTWPIRFYLSPSPFGLWNPQEVFWDFENLRFLLFLFPATCTANLYTCFISQWNCSLWGQELWLCTVLQKHHLSSMSRAQYVLIKHL